MSMLALCALHLAAVSATRQDQYYAHPTVEDPFGVIAPWYTGQNGQLDYRVRIAVETLKRYPWALPPKSAAPAPEYVFNGHWAISPEGEISIPELSDWDNGDLGQRAAYVLSAWVDYYRYSGDPAAIAHVTCMADFLLSQCLTPDDHPWPRFLVSVPTKGKPYGQADPHGMIQLDIVAETGLALLRAYQLTGNERWFDACKRWGDLLAIRCDETPGTAPWNRYANPEDVQWEDHMTGGVVFLLTFFDELIRLGHTGNDNGIVRARNAGQAWLREVLLPRWTVDDTWGRNYWDWPDPVQAENVTEFVARYFIEHPDVFPNWKNDARNILSLFFNRTSVSPNSNGDVFSGAWAYPESSGCCGRSLWYGPMELASVLAQYGVAADSPWARELARRQQILATYDAHDTGVVEDNIDGGMIVAGSWFKITHPMPLKHVLGTIAWLPEFFAPNRENHIVRSSAVVNHVSYDKGRIVYTTFDAPDNTVDVLRLAFRPTRIAADGLVLEERPDFSTSGHVHGYALRDLPNGDSIVTIRHDGRTRVVVEGPDPQQAAPYSESATHKFTGNQVRLIGHVGPDRGLADVFIDDVRQRAPIDCWNPAPRGPQVLYYLNGLPQGEHTVRVAARNAGNPLSTGTTVQMSEVQWSDATGDAGYGAGGGPADAQRMILGYPERSDYVDSEGRPWRPCTEWVCRAGNLADVVNQAWWTKRRRLHVENTPDPELYRYGAHAPEFWVNLTVAPGAYDVRIKFMEAFEPSGVKRLVTVLVNGEERVKDLDIAAAAGGPNRAHDLTFTGVQPAHGVIEIRFRNDSGGEAFAQAIEITPSQQ